jgi:hypothetical protein
MKHFFRAGNRIYEVDIEKDMVVIQDEEAKEKITMPRYEFSKFIEWMLDETKPPLRMVSQAQEIDIWDLSATFKKSR